MFRILGNLDLDIEKYSEEYKKKYGVTPREELEEQYGKITTSLMWDFVHNEEDLFKYKGKLYHYTNTGGLLGILNSQKLWGTNIKYLNDSEEMENGIKLTKKIIKKLSKIYVKQEELNFLESVNNKIKELKESINIYITSLTEIGDDLTQWKGYANHCSGYSIEFEPKKFFKSQRKYPYCDYFLKKIIYKDTEKEEKLENIMKVALDNYEEGELNKYIDLTSKHLIYTMPVFKNKHFHEEKEWRFIYYESDFGITQEKDFLQVSFREGYNTIIPYVELDIADSARKKEWNLPITKITVGARNDFELSKKSISMICKENKIENIKTVKSSIPFR